jgi:hypothetical protein
MQLKKLHEQQRRERKVEKAPEDHIWATLPEPRDEEISNNGNLLPKVVC